MRTAQALLGLALTAWVHLAGATLAVAVLATATLAQAPHLPLNTLKDVIAALRECWTPPPIDQSRAGMQITRRSG